MSDYFNPQFFIAATSESSSDSDPPSAPSFEPSTPVSTPSAALPPFVHAGQPMINISSTFNLHATLRPTPPDTVIASADQVFFFVHFHTLLAPSYNFFGGLLPPGLHPTDVKPFTFVVPEPADVLNVILHCLYELPCDAYSPSLDCIDAAITAQTQYGLDPHHYLARGMPLYETVLLHAPRSPIETYALAAAHKCEDLAVAASAYTLPVPLHCVSHDIVDRIGTRYMHRLLRLHISRMDTLKDLLDAPLYPHVAKPHCSAEQRRVVGRAFQLAGAQVYYSATPALARSGIETIMNSLVEAIGCHDCRESLEAHVKKLVTQWILTQVRLTMMTAPRWDHAPMLLLQCTI
ncbi:hypothetical protein BDW22DRAFT_1357581 [Trametopsis cervina]|nr:hypothetical protein BDW22DRAFT_1357581 [Trametopsis cervina]